MGVEFDIGDTVVYASTVGRSAKLTRGVVVGFKGGGVQIRRTETSWGGKVGKETRYIDSRTGKGIDPSYEKHQVRGYGFIHKPTGDFLTYTDLYRRKILNYDEIYDENGRPRYWSYYDRKQPKYNTEYIESDYQSVRPIYKDYVQEVEKESRPVNVGLGNILKVGEVECQTAQGAEAS